MKKILFILLLSMPFFSFSQIEENQCLEIVSWNLRYFPFSKKTTSREGRVFCAGVHII